MNRETEAHFGSVPRVHAQRSKFDVSHSIKTTFNVGDIVPLEVTEILPGDTMQLDMAEIVRMATPIYPIMDNLFMDIYNFFVPARLTWEHWQQFWGENDDPWIQQNEYEIPQVTAPSGGWEAGTIADYMGIPTYVDNISVSALPFRCYAKVFNDWFRDENLTYSCHMYEDETTRTGSNGTTTVTDVELGGKPAKASKLHDYFTSALPSPQKGPAISIPLGTTANVKTGPISNYTNNDTAYPMLMSWGQTNHINNENWNSWDGKIIEPNPYAIGQDITKKWQTNMEYKLSGRTSDNKPLITQSGVTADPTVTELESGRPGLYLTPSNLYADLSQATAATISELRTAFAIQKFYEQVGRTGSRYIEFLRGVFGVESSDARLQRSEYLGGTRIPINIDQVLQTSSTDTVSPQGNTGAFSCTRSNDSMFTKSFEEHGYVLTLAVIRCEHSYQQGIERMWSRKKWTDFYNPFFANLSERGVENKEIYAQGTDTDEEVFGYQEAWAEYRYRPNRVTGAMRSNYPGGGLDAWHFADDYSTQPFLDDDWILEPTSNVDRTIAVTSQRANQFIGDFYFKEYMTRPMPVYSIPGLIDHV